MKIYGITGGSGSGKTTLLAEFARRGALVIDCDAVYHELLKTSTPLLAELNEQFPGTVALIDGEMELDRKALGAIVFNDEVKLRKLNEISHRYVDVEVKRLLAEATNTVAAIDAIALVEAGLGSMCESVIAVTAPVEARAERIIKREGISKEYALARISAQKSSEWFAENSDYVLENSGTEEEFRVKCSRLLDELSV